MSPQEKQDDWGFDEPGDDEALMESAWGGGESKTTTTDEAKARELLEKRIRRPVDPGAWGYLISKFYVEEFIENDEFTIDHLAREYKNLVRIFPHRRSRISHGQVWAGRTEDKNLQLRNTLLERHAGRTPIVRHMRRGLLSDSGNRLLREDELTEWIMRRAWTEAQRHGVEIEDIKWGYEPIALSKQQIAQGDVSIWWHAPPKQKVPENLLSPDDPPEWDELLWRTEGRMMNVMIISGTPLYYLKLAAAGLALEYGCAEGDMTTFILTGHFPGVTTATCVYEEYAMPPGDRRQITITVDPSVSPRDVARIYRLVCAQIGVKRRREWPEKLRTLIDTVDDWQPERISVERSDSRWEAIRIRWNREYPKWAYDNANRLARDYQRGRKKLLYPAFAEAFRSWLSDDGAESSGS